MCFPISAKKTNIWGQNFLQQQQISDNLQNDTINIVFSILDLTHPQWKDNISYKNTKLVKHNKKKNIFRAKDQIWYTCIKLGVKVHHVLESPPLPVSILRWSLFMRPLNSWQEMCHRHGGWYSVSSFCFAVLTQADVHPWVGHRLIGVVVVGKELLSELALVVVV